MFFTNRREGILNETISGWHKILYLRLHLYLVMKKLRRVLRWVGIIMVLFCIAYLLGPRPLQPVYNTTMPTIPDYPIGIESYITAHEQALPVSPTMKPELFGTIQPQNLLPIMLLFTCMGLAQARKKATRCIPHWQKNLVVIFT